MLVMDIGQKEKNKSNNFEVNRSKRLFEEYIQGELP